MAKLGVIGAGAWGTTLATLAARNGHTVHLLGRDPIAMERYQATNRNLAYLDDIELPRSVHFTADPERALAAADAVLIAIPSEHLLGALIPLTPWLTSPDLPVCSSVKGFLDDRLRRVSQGLPEVLGPHPYATLSGPNLAREVLRGDPSVSVVASDSEATIDVFRAFFGSATFRLYGSRDVTGVELGGAVKNILAIAAGIASAVGFGMNTQAALLSRGMAEMTQLGASLGAEPGTLLGIAGLGDAICTALSPLSRNVQLGQALAQGLSLDEASLRINGIAEGAGTARHVAAYAASQGLDLPITAGVAAVVQGERSVADTVGALMTRSWKMEVW